MQHAQRAPSSKETGLDRCQQRCASSGSLVISGSRGLAAGAELMPAAGEDAAIDPLDAQAAGMDETAFDQGHEEVRLNLEGFEPERPLPPDDAQREE